MCWQQFWIYLLLWSLYKQCCWVQRTLWSHWTDTLFQAGEMGMNVTKHPWIYLGEVVHFPHSFGGSSSSLYLLPRSTPVLCWSQSVQSHWPKSPLKELMKRGGKKPSLPVKDVHFKSHNPSMNESFPKVELEDEVWVICWKLFCIMNR